MIYAFDEADSELTLLPMAARRALDAAGLKLSLAGYQSLAYPARLQLVQAGASAEVDTGRVAAIVAPASPGPEPIAPHREPRELPAELVDALAPERSLDAAGWSRLRPLDRYVLDKLRRRDRAGRLARAYDEIMGRSA